MDSREHFYWRLVERVGREMKREKPGQSVLCGQREGRGPVDNRQRCRAYLRSFVRVGLGLYEVRITSSSDEKPSLAVSPTAFCLIFLPSLASNFAAA